MALKVWESCLKVLFRKRKPLTPLLSQQRNFPSYQDIPESPRFPVVGSLPYLLKSGGQAYLHKYVDNLHKKLGPLFREKFGRNELLFISDPDLNLQVIILSILRRRSFVRYT